MKICILSMQRVNNMGSLLQSYALKSILEQLGNRVEFIDIKKIDEDYAILGNTKQSFQNENEKNGLFGKIKKFDRYTVNRLKIKKKSSKQCKVFEKFRKEELDIEARSPYYDVCVIGSDEVFNCLNAGEWGFTSQLFGNVQEAKKVIIYAASCGSTSYEQVSLEIKEKIREAFNNVSAFSARDFNTHEFISKFTKKEIEDNLDPVLVYNFEREISKVKKLPSLPEKYCIVYSYYNRIHSIKEINEIKEFCKKNNLVPIAIGAPQYWLENYVECSPFQCLRIFKHAEFVITDTFHGTIFSAKYAKKFAVIIRESNRNKLLDLVDKISIQNHLIEDIEDINRVFLIEKDEETFENIVKNEKRKTISYLKKNINSYEK